MQMMMFEKFFYVFKIILNNVFSSNILFFNQMCIIPFQNNLEKILILIIKKFFGEIHSKTYLNTFVSNMFLTLKIMSFENGSLTTIIHFYVNQSMGA
jgi:hypothetical protein